VKADTLKADLRKAGGAGLLDTGGYHVEQVDATSLGLISIRIPLLLWGMTMPVRSQLSP
jgi:hypothetical protein